MIKVNGTTITMTRGDTLKVKLTLTEPTGEDYIPKEGDVIKVGVKNNYSDESCLIEKVLPNDTMILHLYPEDTKNLSFGSYVWDAQITFENGDVNTFIEKAKLKITEEVV